MDDELHGIGDRWIDGERIDGVAFGMNDTVDVVAGDHTGERGSVVLLIRVEPDPVYLVALGSGPRTARVPQSGLRPAG